MLDQAEISVSHLLSWLGMAVGIATLVVNLFIPEPGAGELGVAVIAITCTHIVRCSITAHDRGMREAFQLGREHEKLHSVGRM